MKRTLWKFAAILAAGLMICATPFISATDAVYQTAKRAKDWLVDTVTHGFKLAAGADENHPRMAVMLLQAKAFVMRLTKRERPIMTSSWRMCPST